MRFERGAAVRAAELSLGLVALAVWGCGASDDAGGNGGSSGVAHAGSSSAGSAQGGSATGGRMPDMSDPGGAGGTHDFGVGGLYETCLICGGAFGFGGHGASGGVSGDGVSGSGGVAGSAGGSSGIRCGDSTCGPNQYCRAACNGVGFAGSPSVPSKPSCQALPTGCNGVPSCACVCGGGNLFCTGVSEIQCGCG